MKRLFRMVLVLLLGIGLVIGGFPFVYAEEEEEEKDKDEKEVFVLEEILVTAEKREENMLEVPVTMSVFTTSMISELGMTNKDDLEQLTPGLQFGDEGNKKGQGTVIRGMGSRNWGETHGNQAVAIYVDGVYQHSPTMAAANLFDLERVEVARGPQGTLHGRNSIGGAISFVTKGPTDEWDAEILAEFTDRFSQRYNIAFGGPITDGLSFRIAGGYHDGDGAQENVGPGPDQDAPEEWNVRPKLRFKTDRVELNLRYEKTEDTGLSRLELMMYQPRTDVSQLCFSWRAPTDPRAKDPDDILANCEGWPNNTFFLDPVPVPAVAFCDGELGSNCDELQNKVNTNRPAREDTFRESWTFEAGLDLTEELALNYTFGNSTLEQNYRADGDMTGRVGNAEMFWIPQDIVDQNLVDEFEAEGSWLYDSMYAAPYGTDESSHELQLTSNFDGPFNFIAGLYYYEDTADWHDDQWGFGHEWRFTSADDAAQLVRYDGLVWNADIEEDVPTWSIVSSGQGSYANCSEFLASDEIQMYRIAENEAVVEEGRTVTCAPGSDHTSQYRSHSIADTSTKAAFLSVDFRFSDRLSVSGGLRYTEDESTHTQNSDDYTEAILGVPLIFDLNIRPDKPEQGWNKIIWNASVEYTPADRHMIYGRISTGYRAGGVNSSTGVDVPIEEETVINYEVGTKGLYLDNRLMVTSAFFYNDYDGYQVDAISVNPYYLANLDDPPDWFLEWNPPLSNFVQNVDGTAIWGGELQASWQLSEGWRIGGFYAYLDSSLGTFKTIVQDDANPTIATKPAVYWDEVAPDEWEQVSYTYSYPAPKDFGDGKLPQQPKHKFALTVAYDRPLADLGWLKLLGTWSYTGKRYTAVQNVDSFEVPAYNRLDLRATWTSPKGKWSASLYVQNALDEIGFVEYREGFRPDWAWGPVEAYPRGVLTDPRQIGVVLHWRL